MFYVYILKSQKDDKYYIGSSGNLRERMEQHAKGKVTSTKNRRPLELIFYEAFLNRSQAMRREKYFKTSKGRSSLKMMLREDKI